MSDETIEPFTGCHVNDLETIARLIIPVRKGAASMAAAALRAEINQETGSIQFRETTHDRRFANPGKR